MQLSPLSKNRPVVESNGTPTQSLQLFSEQVSLLSIIVGSGSPEGVISASQARQYMDSGGTSGNIMYIKKLAQIGGNSKLGWVLV